MSTSSADFNAQIIEEFHANQGRVGGIFEGAPLLLLSKQVGQVLDAMPATWLIALQVYRVFGSVFLAGALRGVVPAVFGLPAGIGDVLTGLFAVPAAIAVATGTVEGRKAAIVWNIFGLMDFAVAITLGVLTSPGPLQFIVPNVPSIGAGAYPNVLTPAFVVPISILLHALSLRQLRRRGARRASARNVASFALSASRPFRTWRRPRRHPESGHIPDAPSSDPRQPQRQCFTSGHFDSESGQTTASAGIRPAILNRSQSPLLSAGGFTWARYMSRIRCPSSRM